MLTKKDLELIGALLDDKIDTKLDEKLDQKLDAHLSIFKREVRDEFHSVLKAEIGASEARMIKRMDEGFSSVLELIDDGILPDIHRLQREMIVVQKKLQIV